MDFLQKITDFLQGIQKSFEKTFILQNRYKDFLTGIGNTVSVALVAVLIGIVIGILVAIIKVIHKQSGGKLKIPNFIAELYTTVIRGTPVVLQLLIIYNIMLGSSRNSFLGCVIAFGLNSGAYVAEIIRAGILAVDIGQTEAGRSLGLSQFTTMFHVVLPQALKNILPALGNEFIALLKETSVAGYIGFMDLTKAANRVLTSTGEVYFTLISSALVYLALVYGLSALIKRLERKLARSDRS